MSTIEVYWLGDVEDSTPKIFKGKISRITEDWIILKTKDSYVYLNKRYIACLIERD